MLMDSDIDIARAAIPRPIETVAEQLGLSRNDLIMHGPNVAKISWNSLKNKSQNINGSLILVTSVNPTPIWRRQNCHDYWIKSGVKPSRA